MALDPTRSRSSQTRVAPRVSAGEMQTELSYFLDRLRLLGATTDEIEAVQQNWDVFDPEYGPAERAQMVRWSDARLLAELEALRIEYQEHTAP